MKVIIITVITPMLVTILKDLYDWQKNNPDKPFDWNVAWAKYSTGIWIAVVLGIMAGLGVQSGNLPSA